MNAELLHDVRVAPSILSADFDRLGEQVQTVLDAGARVIHVDVMDGHFVPPITFGYVAVAGLRERVHAAGGLLDVHLMIENPERHVEQFAKDGADSVSIHYEATAHVHNALLAIKDAGAAAGLVLNPATPAESVREVADLVDLVLCMSVNPGWGGQPFIRHSLDKLARLRDLLPDAVALEVDGGVDRDTAAAVVQSGANLLVAGSAIFRSDDPVAAYGELVKVAGAV